MSENEEIETIPYDRKYIDDEDIILSRRTVSPIAYVILVLFFLFSMSAVKFLNISERLQLEYGKANNASFVILTIATIILTILLILKARDHSKRYNENILSVLEYMKRQNAFRFWYSTRFDKSYNTVKFVELIKVIDTLDEGGALLEVEEIYVLDKKINNWPKLENKKIHINDIEEIGIGNQEKAFQKKKRFLQKNQKIKEILRSDRLQLFPFCAAYLTSFTAGVFLGMIL